MTAPTSGLDLILAVSEHADQEAADLRAEATTLRDRARALEDRAAILLQLHRIVNTAQERTA